LQRLFSTFADGWPGRGLLLLRLLTAAVLIHHGRAAFYEALQFAPVIGAVASKLLLVGLWTPVAGALVAIVEVWSAFSCHFSQSGDPWYPIMLAALGAALAMLGPGAWSIDARLFGRKHIDVS
jgi:putative oxidoreductase